MSILLLYHQGGGLIMKLIILIKFDKMVNRKVCIEISKLLNLEFYGPNVIVEGLNFVIENQITNRYYPSLRQVNILKAMKMATSVKILFLTESLLHKTKKRMQLFYYLNQKNYFINYIIYY